jgi:DNA mismatch repair protein MutS2
VTGPNTGGKTVTLKTLGLLAIMAQCGLHIPVLSGSEISVFDFIFADIGDEQSIEQSLSTFSGHITNIIQILKKADRKSLVLLDELGAGTDPQEGAALAMAIVNDLLERQVTCMVATHYPELKTFAHNTRGVMNASLEFDLQTLKPTYHLSLGLPGRSNALAIAERLGLPAVIIARARSAIHPDELRAEDLLDEIYQQRRLAREAREHAEESRKQVLQKERQLSTRLEQIEDERMQLLTKTQADLNDEIASLRGELDEVRRALGRARQPLDTIRDAQDALDEIEDRHDRPVERQKPETNIPQIPWRIGAKVQILSLGMEGVISGLSENEAEVQIGRLRLRSRFSDLRQAGSQPSAEPVPVHAHKTPAEPAKPVVASKPSPGMELDIRGQRAEDALDILDRYLDSAYTSSLPFVRIIHGKGTGRLRQVIREALQSSPHVKHFESGMENEGGDGVTVAHLALD